MSFQFQTKQAGNWSDHTVWHQQLSIDTISGNVVFIADTNDSDEFPIGSQAVVGSGTHTVVNVVVGSNIAIELDSAPTGTTIISKELPSTNGTYDQSILVNHDLTLDVTTEWLIYVYVNDGVAITGPQMYRLDAIETYLGSGASLTGIILGGNSFVAPSASNITINLPYCVFNDSAFVDLKSNIGITINANDKININCASSGYGEATISGSCPEIGILKLNGTNLHLSGQTITGEIELRNSSTIDTPASDCTWQSSGPLYDDNTNYLNGNYIVPATSGIGFGSGTNSASWWYVYGNLALGGYGSYLSNVNVYLKKKTATVSLNGASVINDFPAGGGGSTSLGLGF